MWYIFPQVSGLGSSATSKYYAIKSRREAVAYLTHPLLGTRLLQCTNALLQLARRSAREVMGHPDDLKRQSSMTLFAALSSPDSPFHSVLDRYFAGATDARTLEFLEASP